MSGASTIERAFELAADGRHRSVAEIKKTLSRERYDRVDEHLSGTSIQLQLKRLIVRAARDE